MAAKGSIAKTNVINKIAMAFGNNYIGEIDKKVYVWADDGGEKVQIALALTCPKVQVEATSSAPVNPNDWSDDSPVMTIKAPEKATITEDEKKRIAEVAAMMDRLGL